MLKVLTTSARATAGLLAKSVVLRCFFMQKNTCTSRHPEILYTHTLYKQTGITMTHSNNVVQLSFAFDGAPREVSRPRGWSYLLAESVAFKKDVPHSIRMQKPSEEDVPGWISRLIMSGQCKTIYVENLALDDQQRVVIQQLCRRYAVSVVNLRVTNDEQNSEMKNVVTGPW